MNEDTSFDNTKRETINPLMDELNKQVEPLLKVAMKELGYELPLYVRLYNQIRFYEEYGKLKMGTSVASKETLASQFGVTTGQIDSAFNNLTNKYKLGSWVVHNEPVFRNVTRTWMSNIRLKKSTDNYYSVIPKLLQRNTSTITVEQLASGVRPLSESKKKVSESKNITNVMGDTPIVKGKYGENQQINELFKYWLDITGISISSKLIANRRACNNLLKKHGFEVMQKIIRGVASAHEDKFAPRISDFVELQEKLNKLMLWGKQQQTTKGTIKI
jgi:hypothetical protein